jgi:hypothetical protein
MARAAAPHHVPPWHHAADRGPSRCAAMNKGLEIELCDDKGKPTTPDWCDEYSE